MADNGGDAPKADFIDPQRLFATALGVTVGFSWNTAVREAVDEYVDVESAGGAVWAAVLVTLLAVAVYYTANFLYRVAHSAFSLPEPLPKEATASGARPASGGTRNEK